MTRLAAILLAVVAACACVARADWKTVEERWSVQELGGRPCGRSYDRVDEDGDLVRTVSRVEMRFRRLSQETRVELESEFVETRAGDPVEATVVQGKGERVRYRFVREGEAWFASVERGVGGAAERVAIEGDFLTPREVVAFVAMRHKARAETIAYRALDPQSGLAVAEVAMRRGAEERRTVGGRELPVTVYATTNSLVPVPGSEVVDAEGRSIESAVTFPGLGELRVRLADKAAADRAYDAATFDLLAGTFVRTKPIARYAERERLAVLVKSDIDGVADLPSAGAQVAARVDARTQRVEVDVRRGSAPEAGDAADRRWLRPTELMDFESDAVRELLASARLPEDVDASRTAEALRELVHRHLRRKDMATAFGSASEAARTRSGDCTEHGVLLAALLRAKGIPSRVASGLVYVPAMNGQGPGFGWHLWTQALVPWSASGGGTAPAWVDFDATQGGGGRGFHAAHILVATSDLAGGATDPAFARAIALLGGTTIEPVDPISAERVGAK
ncbi:MAG: transglutaminase-like domain-containing protein [Phycisphaerales bacterium]